MSDHGSHTHDSPHSQSGEHHDDHGDHGGVGKYVLVFLALCVLTTFSFLTYFDWWRERVPMTVGWSFMMAVSCTKALLVMAFFMHLIWEANWKYVLTIPAMLMSVFLICMLVPDIGMRTYHYSPQRWLFAAEPAPYGIPLHGGHGHGSHDDSHSADETPGSGH